MIRWILVAIVIWLVLRLVRRSQTMGRPRADVDRAVNLIACAQCGLRFDAKDAIAGGDKSFCCAQHRDEWELRH